MSWNDKGSEKTLGPGSPQIRQGEPPRKKHMKKTNRMIEIMTAANSELEKINGELK